MNYWMKVNIVLKMVALEVDILHIGMLCKTMNCCIFGCCVIYYNLEYITSADRRTFTLKITGNSNEEN